MQYLIQSFADVKRLEKYKWVKFELPVKGTGKHRAQIFQIKKVGVKLYQIFPSIE